MRLNYKAILIQKFMKGKKANGIAKERMYYKTMVIRI